MKKMDGGVTVYCKNIVSYMKEKEDIEVYFLSNNCKYTLFSNKIKIKKTKNCFKDKVKTFSIYNSKLFYAEPQFERIDIYNNDKETCNVIDEFIKKYGKFDVIHFNNLEGISRETLKLKEKYPNTKFIYSIHNYFPICPNVFLWKKNNESCVNYNEGRDCVNCIQSHYPINGKRDVFKKFMKGKIKKIKILDNPNIKRYLKKKIIKEKSVTNSSICNGKDYKKFREDNIKYINSYIDEVLCVSERVREIAVRYGIDENKCRVSYIGTKVANEVKEPVKYRKNEKINIVYMGYMNKIKGFDFLISALKQVNDKYSKQVNVFLVCRNNDKYEINKILKELKTKYNDVKYINGYNHNTMKEILKDKNLGIIPVVWEDNLPQVAIELVCNGIPIFTSDVGGAKELCADNNFVFKGNDIKDFVSKLENIIKGDVDINGFWNKFHKPTTMEQHLNELYKIYEIN